MNYLVLDFDGVINVVHTGSLYDYAHYDTKKISYCTVRYSPELVTRINSLSYRDDVTVLWLSSWLGDSAMFSELGFNKFGYIHSDCFNTVADWKKSSLLEFIDSTSGEDSRIFWVDDEEDKDFLIGYDNVYCFTPDPNRGLILPDLDEIERLID